MAFSKLDLEAGAVKLVHRFSNVSTEIVDSTLPYQEQSPLKLADSFSFLKTKQIGPQSQFRCCLLTLKHDLST